MTNRNADALLRHALRERQKQILRNAVAPLPGHRSDALLNADEKVQMTETRIYVGLNDAVSRKQEHDTDHFLAELKYICRSRHVAFSVDVEEGGYYHEDGEYTEETSLVLVLIDADREVVEGIAKELCARFHQESVLETEDRIVGRFLQEDA